MVRDSLLQREEQNPRMIKLESSLQEDQSREISINNSLKKYPLIRLVRLHSALEGDVPNRRERKSNIFSRD